MMDITGAKIRGQEIFWQSHKWWIGLKEEITDKKWRQYKTRVLKWIQIRKLEYRQIWWPYYPYFIDEGTEAEEN